MDVTNLDQNPLILSILECHWEAFYANSSVACHIFIEIGTWHNCEVRNPKVP